MEAAHWMSTKDIRVGPVPKPTITTLKDAIVRTTHCTTYGSDLHIHLGKVERHHAKERHQAP